MKLAVKTITKEENVYSRIDNVITKTSRNSGRAERLEYATNSAAKRALNEFNIGGK